MSTESSEPSQHSPPKDPHTPILRAHVYDGIQEFDQKLPNWWLFTLWTACIFFLFYWMAYYQFGFAKSDEQRLDPVIAELREKRTAQVLAMLDDPNKLWEMSRDPAFVSEGEQIYNNACVVCHGPNLGGTTEAAQYIGRSLVDSEWTYGGESTEIYQMIYNGTPNPADAMKTGAMIMPPQGTLLGAEKTAKVTAFVLSKHSRPEDSAIPTEQP